MKLIQERLTYIMREAGLKSEDMDSQTQRVRLSFLHRVTNLLQILEETSSEEDRILFGLEDGADLMDTLVAAKMGVKAVMDKAKEEQG
jgi:hypothetical protein